MSDEPPPARAPAAASLFRLSLEQQRKRAKDLLAGLRAGDPDAIRRGQRHLPRERVPRLSDAQHVVARELGLPSWPRLKDHIRAMEQSRERIARGGVAPDRGMATLHLRCGSDIETTLKQAGFGGDFLEYSDPLCQGPVRDDPSWLDRRADFLAGRLGAVMGRSREQIAASLRRAEERLCGVATRYQRVVLWFEHDSYDQLILARCLAQFAEAPPPRLELVSAAHFPGQARFIGLGQLPPEALRLLWEDRRVLPEAALRAGHSAWAMLRAPDPRPLAALAGAGAAGLPQLGPALRRHCQELPWTGDGLSLTERLLLQLLAEAPCTIGRAFGRLMQEREPLPWLSDLLFLAVVEDMLRASPPVLTADAGVDDRDWPSRRLAITPLGRAVLEGKTDYLSLHPPPRWLGGVSVAGSAPGWRWDDATESVVTA